jgi:excisionase family DNA binding protein
MKRKLLTLPEAAEILDLSYAGTARLARKGILQIVKIGRQVRVDPNQLDTFIEQGGADCR